MVEKNYDLKEDFFLCGNIYKFMVIKLCGVGIVFGGV